MRHFYSNMIRSTPLVVFGKYNHNILLFTQRAARLPKQTVADFSVIPDAKKESEIKKPKNNETTQVSSEFRKLEAELKYSVLKNAFKGNMTTVLTSSFKKDSTVQEFFRNLKIQQPSEIIKLLKMFAQTNTRPVTALKSICDALLTKECNYTEWECSDLFYSLSKLTYRHEGLVTLVTNYLKNQENFNSFKTATSLLNSFGALRVRDNELIDKLLKSLLGHPFKIKSSLEVILSLSILNYSSIYTNAFIEPLSTLRNTDYQQTKDYINFIWACILLNKINFVSTEHLSMVLSKNFIEKLNYGLEGFQEAINLKLLNINAAASQIPSYNGPFLNKLPHYKFMSPPISKKQKTPFLESVRDSLSYIITKNGYMETLVDTGCGFHLDLECYLDKKNRPASSSINKNQSRKIGVILLNYNDFCTDGTMTGISSFKLNILKGLGYKIMTVPYYEYPLTAKLSDKIIYLQTKMKNLVEISSQDSDVKEPVTKE